MDEANSIETPDEVIAVEPAIDGKAKELSTPPPAKRGRKPSQPLADVMTNGLEALGVAAFGEAGKYNAEAGERKAIKDAFNGYIKANQMTDLPPNVALVVAVSIYAVPRLATSTKAKSLWSRIKLRLASYMDKSNDEKEPKQAKE